MSYTAPTRTWGDVKIAVTRSFGDEAGVQLEEGDITRFINQAQYEIARANKILKARGSATTAAGQASYELDLGRPILQIESVRYGDRRLTPVDFTTVDANYEEYPKDAKGDPRIWYRWGNEITLWPQPKAAETLSIYFTAGPDKHESFDGNRLLELPDDYFQPLFDFVMAKAHEMDENLEAQQVSTQLYAERMSTMNNEERGGQTLTYQTINIVD